MDWIKDVILPFLWALFGGLLTLAGTMLTFYHEKRVRQKENVDKAKPILINYMAHQLSKEKPISKFIFEAGGKNSKRVKGVFKNTDNALMFLDCIETDATIYYSKFSTTVDKNTELMIYIEALEDDDLKECRIYCHDIFGNQYYYNASFCFEDGAQSQIILDNDMPISASNKRTLF